MPDLMSSVPETLYKNSYWGKEIAFNHFRNQYLLNGSQRNIYKKNFIKRRWINHAEIIYGWNEIPVMYNVYCFWLIL